MKNYIEQVVNYIQDGILAREYVLLIENEPTYRKIEDQLKTRLTKEQFEFVHFVNNFDFYYSSGSYHPPAIVDYFNKTIQSYLENEVPFRTWAHVEWATMKEPLNIIEDLEKVIDEAVNVLSFPLICAYEAERMPDYLKNILMETHPYVLVENEVIISNQYQPKITK